MIRALGFALALSLALSGPAQAKWLRAESQKFVIYSDGDERSLREYVSILEDFDIVLRHYHGVSQKVAPLRKLEIYLVRDQEELRRSTFADSENLAGFYEAGEDDIFAVATRDLGGRASSRGERSDTLFHEYTHHFISQYATFPYPGWMVEGLAEYFATTEIWEGRLDVGEFNKGRAYTLSGPWIPLELLLGKANHELNQDARLAYYAQAWLLTHYMLNNPQRRQQLEAYKALVAEGGDPVASMTQATGLDPKALKLALEAYTRKPLPYLTHGRQKLADAPIAITELSRSADDLLLENQKLMNGVPDGAEKPLLETIRQRAARYPGDRLATLTLARAEVLYGEQPKGEALLTSWLAANPDDAEALRLSARSRLLSAFDATDAETAFKLAEEARPFLVRASRLQKNSYQTFYYFTQSKMFEGNYPSDNDLMLLLSAQSVAPQVDTITFQAAQALVIHDRLEEARPMLMRLANDPHGGGLASAARKLLDEASAKSAR